MTIQELYGIFRSLVIYAPEVRPGLVLESFVVMNDRDQLSAANLGMQYEDYLEGYMWSRDWVEGGADPGELRVEYPVLVVETKTSIRQSLERRDESVLVYISVMDTPKCARLLHENRTKEKVYQDCFGMMRSVMGGLKDTYWWDLVVSGSALTGWMHQGQYDALNIDQVTGGPIPIDSYIQSEELVIYKDPYLNHDQAVGVSVEVEFAICEDAVEYTNFPESEVENKGIVSFNPDRP